VQLERDVLGVIREQLEEDKKHLMDLIAFYTFGDEINMVFPYLEGNLEKLLYTDWLPSNVNHDEQFPNNWISRGLLGLADGLRIIHNPPTQLHLAEKGTIVGFHFDLKPANILITADGTFKITDFGQALIKLVKVGEISSGGVPHLGGDPRYAPPEEIPTRERITRSSYKYLHEDRSVPEGRWLTVHGPQTDAVSVPSQRLNVPTNRRVSMVSHRSAPVSQEPLGSAKYDIWSLGCVALEVLVHTCLGGMEAVEDFQDERRRDGPPGAFHTSQGKHSELQTCVQNQLDALKTGQTSTYSWSSPMQIYMHDLVNLLQKMLSIREDDRPDAPEVAGELEWALRKFKIAATDEDGLVNTLRDRTSHILRSNWSELAHDTMGTPFIDIEDIYVRDFNAGPSLSRCRIRVYANRPNRGDGGAPEVIVFVAFKKNGVVVVESLLCPLSKTTRYSPLYLNTATDAAWKDSCRLQTDKFDKLFLFKSNPAELLSFQAVLFQYLVEPGRVTAESSLTEISWNLYRSISPPVKVVFRGDDYTEIELKALAVQIWTTKPHTSAQRFPSQVTTPSTTSSGQNASKTRLVIFLDPQENAITRKRYHILQIPLEPRLGSIVEGGLPGDGTDAVATTLSFKPTDEHATNGGFTVLLSEVRGRFPKPPVLSLDPEIYRRITDPLPERRCRGIIMTFHSNSGMYISSACATPSFLRANVQYAARAAIQTIRRHFETANESNQPKITWKERSANRRQRRSIP
jgi:serine/threonine protein kinase